MAGKGQSKKGKTKDDETAETFTERPPAVAGKGQSKKGKTKGNETPQVKGKGKRSGLEVREKLDVNVWK